MSHRVPPTVIVLVLGLVLAAFAFQWGRATASAPLGRRQTAVVEAVEHAAGAVVSVEAVLGGGRSRGAGSGVIVHPQGYVITNSHVIRGGTSITVKPFQSAQRFPAQVIANDPAGDLALLRIVSNTRWRHVSLCPSAEVALGETAIAIGNPRGLGDSITVGVVSAKGRVAKMQQGSTIRNLIQTDAPINSGNSGGALLNLDGELIGVNASMLPSAEGIAFAIPADNVALMLRRALGTTAPENPLPASPTPTAGEGVPPPRVGGGLRVAEVPDDLTPLRPSDVGLLIDDDGCRLVIRRVAAGSPAAAALLRAGDLVLEVDGDAVESVDEVRLAFAAARPGRVYEMRIRRGAATLTAVVEIPR